MHCIAKFHLPSTSSQPYTQYFKIKDNFAKCGYHRSLTALNSILLGIYQYFNSLMHSYIFLFFYYLRLFLLVLQPIPKSINFERRWTECDDIKRKPGSWRYFRNSGCNLASRLFLIAFFFISPFFLA